MNTTKELLREPPLSETGKNILDTFKKVMPSLSPIQQARLLGLAEGLDYKNQNQSA